MSRLIVRRLSFFSMSFTFRLLLSFSSDKDGQVHAASSEKQVLSVFIGEAEDHRQAFRHGRILSPARFIC
jgi:hypothetical protein